MGPVLSTVVAVLIVALLVGGALAYIIHAKKSGKKCIGCPDGDVCTGKCDKCNCGCGAENKK
ncbi:MAG: FeoB-associated Cys-rich membrane protein [Clostridia bacterium]|nr:FeoB-associated Cys-rich membrane protein [Clostridia bacterium]